MVRLQEKNNRSTEVARAIISPIKVLIFLLGVSVLLVMVHLLLSYLLLGPGLEKLQFFGSIFDVDNESSIPTWFSQFILLVSAAICGTIAYAKMQSRKDFVWQWWVMAGVFLLLSIDEIATIHEQLISIIQRSDFASELGISSWYLYAGIAVAVVGVLLVKFWWKLPAKTRWLLLGSAAVYLAGAVYMDVVGGRYVGAGFLHTGLIIGVEEGLEMVGASLFIYTLLDYAKSQRIGLLLSFAK